MNYNESLAYIYSQIPMFHRSGSQAYKPGLERVTALSEYFGSPHLKLKAIHIAGTNGKGSTAHAIASVLQEQGYNVGLFTSPHLIDFRERIRINGEMVPEQYVADFVSQFRDSDISKIQPSFFELTTVMAMCWMACQKVDFAVVETGLGGRLDATNILCPLLCVITNIALDHTALLGESLQCIASEKAGIIKPHTPVVIGQTNTATSPVFKTKATKEDAPILFADCTELCSEIIADDNGWQTQSCIFGNVTFPLGGYYQRDNLQTILAALAQLKYHCNINITDQAVRRGLAKVEQNTGLAGRWTVLSRTPLAILDVAHNPDGWTHLCRQIPSLPGPRHIVLGFVADKDVDTILSMISSLPQCRYYFASPQNHRALQAEQLSVMAQKYNITGHIYANVADAYAAAISDTIKHGGMVLVAGSCYLAGDLLKTCS